MSVQTDMTEGIIVKGIGGFYYVESNGEIYECKARGSFRKERLTPLVGDCVEIKLDEKGYNSIEQIKERKNFFNRPPVANIDKLVIVVSTCEPVPNFLIIDRLTCVAFYKNVQPVIVITKDDLKNADEIISIYKITGIPVFVVSNNDGNDELTLLKNALKGSVCAFTGNSGVGKSTLLNRLYSDLNLETGEISQKLGRGRHTTRCVELFKTEDGYIADTPGFASLDFETNDIIVKEELAYCFPEFQDYLGKCKFTSCSHTGDKGCKIKDVLEQGLISKSRYNSYTELYNEVKNIQDWQL